MLDLLRPLSNDLLLVLTSSRMPRNPFMIISPLSYDSSEPFLVLDDWQF